MKINYGLLIILFCTSVVFSQMRGKQTTSYGFEIDSKPLIYYDLFLELNSGKQDFQLNFVIKIQYDLLYFIRTEGGYVSGYDISLNIKDLKSRKTVYSQLWKESVSEEDFEITNSRRHYHINSKSFHVDFPPGRYQLNLVLTDETSGREFKSSREFEIPDLSAENYLSEIYFLTQDRSQSAEIILDEEPSVIEFNRDLYPLFQFKLSESGKARVKSELYSIRDGDEELLNSEEKTLEGTGPFYRFEQSLSKKDLAEGDYLLRYTVITEQFEEEKEKYFRLVWYQKPLPMYDQELAMLPMRYLFSESEWDDISRLSSAKQKKWYDSYWKEKDPDPETPLNEVQLEFYNRVVDANKRFRSEHFEGWNTDRGKALILYGDPDKVDAKRYLDSAQSYEVWYYTQKNKKLIFIDKDEDGSYILVSIEDI